MPFATSKQWSLQMSSKVGNFYITTDVRSVVCLSSIPSLVAVWSSIRQASKQAKRKSQWSAGFYFVMMIPNSIVDSTYVVAEHNMRTQTNERIPLAARTASSRSTINAATADSSSNILFGSIDPHLWNNTSATMAKFSFLLSLLLAALVAISTSAFAPQQAFCKCEVDLESS